MSGELSTCCGFIRLRLGCFIIGYLQLVQLIFVTTLATVYVSVALFSRLPNVNISGDDPKSNALIYMMFIIIYVIILFLLTLMIIFTIILLVGLHKKKPGMLTAFLVYSVIYNFLYITGFVIVLSRGMIGPVSIISGLINIPLGIYFMLLIKSYHSEMVTELGKPFKY